MLIVAARAKALVFWWLCTLVLLPSLGYAAWFNTSWNYRVPISIPAGAPVNSTIKIDVDFNALLSALGVAGTFDANSPRVVRPSDVLATTQEFTDTVYLGATDAAGNGQGEVRFLLEDAGPTTYYLYFDIVANGPKAANPQTPINGNFERGATGTQSPTGWTATKTNNSFDAQVRPSESPSITTDTGTPNPVTTDGTPYTGAFSYLMGARTNVEPANSAPAVTLTRTIVVPATSPGNLVIRYRPEGWDSSDDGAAQWDFLRIRLISASTTEIVGPTFGSYTTYPFSPNKGTGAVSNNASGYGNYNGWDTDNNGVHHAGMTLAKGSQPWFTRTYSLAAYTGQTITLQFTSSHSLQFKSWIHIDDVEWSVIAGGVGSPEAQFVNPGGFNAYEVSTAAGAITGVIKTKIAGASFNLDLIALNTAKTAIETRFTGAVKVELLNASNNSAALDANGCRSSWSTIQTLATNPVFVTANNGRLTVAFSENNSWPEVRVRITYPATGTATAIGCSTDNFAIRPNSFASINITDLDWATAGVVRTLNNVAASGGVVHKAGQPLRVSAQALNAASAVTTNYTGSPSATPISCLLPSACLAANLGTFTLGGSFSAGVLTTSTATYSEVGAFTLQLLDTTFANVDASDSSTAERYITSTAINVGRFVPDHFDLAANATPQLRAACAAGPYTYIGQPFGYHTLPQSLVLARSAGGATTVNYTSNLWKIVAAGVTQTYAPLTPLSPGLDVSGIGVPVVTALTNGTGSVTSNSADSLFYTRSASLVAPFSANITLTVSVQDTAENATSQGIINTTTPLVYNGGGTGIAFQYGNQFFYGRLKLYNALGSDRASLPVPMRAQYFNGTGFVTNLLDNCSSFTLTPITPGAATYQYGALLINNPLGAMTVSASVPSPSAITLAGGSSAINMGAPFLTGSVDLTLTVPAWLQYNWTGVVGNPKARATFGAYANTNAFIYQRENY